MTPDFQKEDVDVKSECGWRDQFPVVSGNSVRNEGMHLNQRETVTDQRKKDRKRHQRTTYAPKGVPRLIRTLVCPPVLLRMADNSHLQGKTRRLSQQNHETKEKRKNRSKILGVYHKPLSTHSKPAKEEPIGTNDADRNDTTVHDGTSFGSST